MDHWKHRSSGMTCYTCMWFVEKPKEVSPAVDEPNNTVSARGTIGRCRRHAPTMSGYPVVFENDWCGDHKLDEKAA